jgi:hypothetical protein
MALNCIFTQSKAMLGNSEQCLNQGGTKRAAVAAPLPGNFSEKPSWQEISLRTIHARKFELTNQEIFAGNNQENQIA